MIIEILKERCKLLNCSSSDRFYYELPFSVDKRNVILEYYDKEGDLISLSIGVMIGSKYVNLRYLNYYDYLDTQFIIDDDYISEINKIYQ